MDADRRNALREIIVGVMFDDDTCNEVGCGTCQQTVDKLVDAVAELI